MHMALGYVAGFSLQAIRMDDQQYEYLVRRLELEAHDNPARFRTRVLAVSGAAYLVLALILLAAVALGLAAFVLVSEHRSAWLTFQLGIAGIALLGILYTVLRAFLTRLSPPAGREVGRDEAPRLFELIDRVRDKLKGPPLERVVIDRSFNAAIAQVPRFGLFGGHRNHLVIGLPYLFAMSTREMLATLAHEYGHLAGAHGKVSTWVHRQRLTFAALLARVERDNGDWFDSLLLAALRRFAPYFNAYTFVLSREDEYEADAAASHAAGHTANARSLCRGELLGRWYADDFWPRLYAQADHRASPLLPPYASLRQAFAENYNEWCTEERLADALRRKSDLHDTHPCLRDRLDAIERPPQLPPPVEECAADVLLQGLAERLAREFDEQWWQEERERWQAHFRKLSEHRRKAATLGEQPLEKLNPFELQELGSALAACRRDAEARPVLEHLLARSDGPFPRAEMLYGVLLLENGNAGGLAHLTQAAADDARLADECMRHGYAFLHATCGPDEAERWIGALEAAAAA